MGTVFESYSRRQGVDSDTISGHLSRSQPTTRKMKLFVFLLMTMLVTVHGQDATVTTAAESTIVANTATNTTSIGNGTDTTVGDGTDVATGDDTDAGTDDTDAGTDVAEECVDTKSAKKCKKALRKNKCNKKKYAIGCAKTCGYCEAV